MATVTIEGRFAMTTPLFCGGADPARAELRIPSFKGCCGSGGVRWLGRDVMAIWERFESVRIGCSAAQQQGNRGY